MENNKGFTLVELMIVLVILTLIVAISVPTFSNIMGNAETNTYASSGEMIEKAAEMAAVAGEKKDTYTVGELKAQGYLDADTPAQFGSLSISDDSIVDLKGNQYVYRGDYIQDGLQLHYDFSGYTNTTHDLDKIKDLSGNGNDVEMHGFDGTPQSGFTGQGLRFDGVNDLAYNLDGSMLLPMDSPIHTFSYTIGVHENKRNNILYDGERLKMDIYGNRLSRADFTGSHVAVNYTQFLDTINHVDSTYDGTTYRLYVNGELIHESARQMSSEFKGILTLGRYIESGRPNVTMYNLQAYDRALDADEIKHNYNIDKMRFNIQD